EWYNIWIELITPHLEESINIMKQANPAVIPRNYLVEEAISEVITTGKQTKLKDLLNKLENPYAYSEDQLAYIFTQDKYDNNYQSFYATYSIIIHQRSKFSMLLSFFLFLLSNLLHNSTSNSAITYVVCSGKESLSISASTISNAIHSVLDINTTCTRNAM